MTGRITGPDGSPIAAQLAFRPVQPTSVIRSAHTSADSSGLYSVRLAVSTYDVVIQPNTSGLLYHVQRVELNRASTRFDHRFSGHVLTGTVRDPEGAVVDSGRAWIEILTPSPYTIGATDLIHGAFSFLLSTGTYQVHATSEDHWSGFGRMTTTPFTVYSDTTVEVDQGGAPVTGTAFSPSGDPMERVAVDALGGEHPLDQAHARTAPDGRYRLWLHPGTYRFRSWPLDSFHISARLTDPLSIQGPSNVDFDFAGAEWTGVVRWNGSETPVADVWVTAYEVEEGLYRGTGYKTGLDGWFRLIVTPGHEYDLVAYAAGQEMVHYGLTARTDTTFVLEVDPIGSVTAGRWATPIPPGGRDIPSRGSSGP